MKGLLLKDFYMMKKYCRSYLLFLAVFILISAVGDDAAFFGAYPCLLAGTLPVTLLGYDERSGWARYCGTLPYTKAQLVSVKYLIGLAAQITVVTLSALAQGIRMGARGALDLGSLLALAGTLLVASCVPSAISLPFMFKLGVEKGRIAYYVMIGVACAGSVAAMNLLRDSETLRRIANGPLPVLCAAAVAVYALSWGLSVAFYKKRELN